MSIEDFNRVNAPRAEKAIKLIEMIEKSARSYKVPAEVSDELFDAIVEACPDVQPEQEVRQIMQEAADDLGCPPMPEDGTPVPTSETVAAMSANYDKLPTSNLIDILAAAGAALAKRRR